MSSGARASVAVALVGSGGAGVMTIGALLLETAARAGYYGLFSRLAGPQVRGGEAAALLRIGTTAIESPPDHYDLMVAIDWSSVDRFAPEIPLTAASIVMSDPLAGPLPEKFATAGPRRCDVALEAIARGTGAGRYTNLVALGAACAVIGLPLELVRTEVATRFRDEAAHHVEASVRALEEGYAAFVAQRTALGLVLSPPDAAIARDARWLASGNELAGLGLLRAGVRFVTGYPITPATELVEWLAPNLHGLGGRFVQSEDELAAINTALGASYAGVPAATVTSGPGLDLMIEALGLATAAEIPVVAIDVMRAGPSTGIPTKSEQSDLNVAVYGGHGDAPRIVLAPTSVADCLPTTEWAVALAETFQTPVLVLSDQALGQCRSIVPRPQAAQPITGRAAWESGARTLPYRRYANTDDGRMPMAAPGHAGTAWIAEGLTHDEAGNPSAGARDHRTQIEKRARKLARIDFGDRWGAASGAGELAVIVWGSTTAAAAEAIERLREDALNIRLIALRLLAPLPIAPLREALRGVQQAIVIEQNHGAQLHRLLRAELAASDLNDFRMPLASYARSGPLPLRPLEIERAIIEWSHAA